ncbi:ADAMTS-like protein 4 [Eumeta japonica]|uniref:ADAMTS-like protein 4 n=1 Tax=Eumeta variegata TaxID=151549 RepID=A0A4C1T6I7_EUMVA|nr:ADAMTS-like protein 4 [Eumeta japonica]
MVVGRESVLAAAAAREVRCGRRLVSGLFSRPRLPLGYSRVATVPRGACRLNVSELLPSENYIALKVVNGSYIVNGEFAVSADGAYEAAGARFQYARRAGRDSVFARGPIQEPIDIMVDITNIVHTTEPEHKIRILNRYGSRRRKDANDIPIGNNRPPPPPPARHPHRHHNAESHTRVLDRVSSENGDLSNSIDGQRYAESDLVGGRKFTWKVLTFTQCTRSCGGGLQIGKFKCVEEGEKPKEVSAAHCAGAAPPSRRRRCGAAPCPPRWRAAPWGPCPVCGPAHRTRIVGCVQDHARGITKISDQKCPLPMPASSEPCDVPNCDGSPSVVAAARPDTRRQVRVGDGTDNFRDSPVYQFAVNTSDNDIASVLGPEYAFSAAGGWLYTDWSECVGWCIGGGLQTRGVRCADAAGCAPRRAPEALQHCTPRLPCDPHEGQWFTNEWSPCTAACGGRQIRGVVCLGGAGRRLRDSACRAPRPEAERGCGGECSPTWYLSDWSECEGPCEAGIQKRTVWCARGGVEGAAGAARDTDCPGTRPPARRACVPARCTTRPAERTAPLPPFPPRAPPTDPQQRVTRHQSNNSQANNGEHSITPSIGCADRLSNCALAVQARLCHYHYYAEYCCRSCHGR